MIEFNIPEFIRDNAGLSTLQAIEKAYQQGRADQLEEDKGKEWELMLIKLGRKQGREDMIDDCIEMLNCIEKQVSELVIQLFELKEQNNE